MKKDRFLAKSAEGRQVTAVEALSSRCFTRHSHDEFGIGVILAGAQRSWSGRGHVEAHAGDIITVNPGEVHDGAPIGESRKWAMLYISPEKMADMASDIHESARGSIDFIYPVLSDRVSAGRFAAAYAAFTTRNSEAADERLMLLVAGVLHDMPQRQPTKPPPVTMAKARIDDDPTDSHPLSELALLSGASNFQTIRGFARHTGLTPHAYVVQRRLDIARSLIRNGAALAEAAFAAGFADQSHLHRSFTSRYGMTPGTFANAMR